MEATHLYALIPLLVLLALSFFFSRSGLLHLMTLGYVMVLSWFAVINEWEVLFFPMLLLTGIIAILLFITAIVKGDWL